MKQINKKMFKSRPPTCPQQESSWMGLTTLGELCKYGSDSSGKVEMETKYTTLETNKQGVIDIALSLKNRLENMIIPIDKMALTQNGF